MIALVGSANSGKTTLFNLLTGSHYNTVNYPGATVEFALGQGKGLGFKCRVMDTPGLSSLIPSSLDEKVTVDALFARHRPDVVVAVVDATQLSRHLYLVKQLDDLGFNLIIALTMPDLMSRRGLAIDAGKLSELMECPVFPIDPRRKEKAAELGRLIERRWIEGRPESGRRPADEAAYRAFAAGMDGERVQQYYAALDQVESLVVSEAGADAGPERSGRPREGGADGAGRSDGRGAAAFDARAGGTDAGAQGLDPSARGIDQGTGGIDADARERDPGARRTAAGAPGIGAGTRGNDGGAQGTSAPGMGYGGRQGSFRQPGMEGREGDGRRRARSDAADRILLHPVWGLGIFLFSMFAIFTAIFWLATPFMDGIDAAFGWAIAGIKHALPGSWVVDLFADGAVGGLGMVMVFLPQILILFFAMGYLEDSGYLARGAALVDKPLSMIGLNGKSFVPLLSGYACAIPAMLAARTIPNRYERNLTIFIIPLMSCSARLPVYTLLLAFITPRDKPWIGGLALTGLYLAGLVLGAAVSTLISRIIKNNGISGFILELPALRKPVFKVVAISTYHKAQQYLRKAGLTILIISMGLWVLTHTPPQARAAVAVPHAAPAAQDMPGPQGFPEPVAEDRIATAARPEEGGIRARSQGAGAEDAGADANDAGAGSNDAGAGSNDAGTGEVEAGARNVEENGAGVLYAGTQDAGAGEEYVAVSHSYAAQVGRFLEPVTRPMGLDWRGGVAMICGFAAREVFVSAMALMYRLDDGEQGDEGVADRLLARMAEVRFEDTGARVFTLSSVLGVILFFMIALQCFPTVAVSKAESGGWKLAAAQLILYTGTAYGLAVALVQGLRALGAP